MNDSKRIWVWVGVAVVVIAVGLTFLWPHSSAPVDNNTTQAGPKFPAAYAPKGQLASGFPTELILDANAKLSSSYSISYSASTNLYTTQFNSSSSVVVMYGKYKTFLPANGWVIKKDTATQSTYRALVADNATSDVLVAIQAKGKGSQVTVTYDTK